MDYPNLLKLCTDGFLKLLSTHPIHIVVWGNFPFNPFLIHVFFDTVFCTRIKSTKYDKYNQKWRRDRPIIILNYQSLFFLPKIKDGILSTVYMIMNKHYKSLHPPPPPPPPKKKRVLNLHEQRLHLSRPLVEVG